MSSTDQNKGLTTLGRIGAPYGIKGWVKLISYTDPPENILELRQYILGASNLPGAVAVTGKPERVEIDDSRAQGKEFVGHIRGCDDRDQARLYTGRDLQVETTALPELDDENYYWFQLEGLQVINRQNEILGTVHHLMETGANDVLVVKPDESSIDDVERLIPWIREQVIIAVDLAGKRLKVDWEKDY